MAVTIVSNLTNLDECDVTDDWALTQGAGGLEANDEFERTGTACIGAKVSNEEAGVELTFPGGSRDMSGEHLYFWLQATLALDPAGTGMRVLLSDGTNVNEYEVADATTYLGGWQRFCLECDATPTVDNSANIAAITIVGFEMDTATAVTGNISSFFVDKVDVQPSAEAYAIEVSGGTTGARGTWQEIVDAAINDAIGIVERRNGIIVLNGPIEFGITTAADTYFEDANEVCVFQNHFVEDAFYALNFVGNSGQVNSFVLGEEVGSGDDSRGTGGGLITSAGPTFLIEAEDANIIVDFWGVTIDGAGITTWQQTNAQAVSCTWTNSDSIIHDNNAEMREGTISASIAVSGVGAVEFLQNPVTPDFRDMSIINCIHAIEWSVNGANDLDLRGIKFAGNTADVRFNHTTGLLTVNVLELSDTPSTSDGGGGGTITVIASNPVTITVVEGDFVTVVEGARVGVHKVSDNSEVFNGLTNASGIASGTTSFAGDVIVKVREEVLDFKRQPAEVVAGTGLIQTISAEDDPNYTAT